MSARDREAQPELDYDGEGEGNIRAGTRGKGAPVTIPVSRRA